MKCPSGLVEAALAAGARRREVVQKVLIPEALPSLVSGVTITTIGVIGYSAMAGAVGGGGLGDVAIRYGYQRYETEVTIATVVVLVVAGAAPAVRRRPARPGASLTPEPKGTADASHLPRPGHRRPRPGCRGLRRRRRTGRFQLAGRAARRRRLPRPARRDPQLHQGQPGREERPQARGQGVHGLRAPEHRARRPSARRELLPDARVPRRAGEGAQLQGDVGRGRAHRAARPLLARHQGHRRGPERRPDRDPERRRPTRPARCACSPPTT